MIKKRTIAIVIAAMLVLASMPALAATGKMKVILKDGNGVRVNGKVVVKKGDTVKKCTTTAGSCTIKKLKKGEWKVSAKTADGKYYGGPKKVTVKPDKTVTTTVRMKKK